MGRHWGDVQELGDDGSRGDLDQDDVIESDAVERVEQREAALDLVRFDHALEDVLDRDVFALARQVVRDGEDCPEIVGWVAPCKETMNVVLAIELGARSGGETRTRHILRQGSNR